MRGNSTQTNELFPPFRESALYCYNKVTSLSSGLTPNGLITSSSPSVSYCTKIININAIFYL